MIIRLYGPTYHQQVISPKALTFRFQALRNAGLVSICRVSGTGQSPSRPPCRPWESAITRALVATRYVIPGLIYRLPMRLE